jgi:hypothetical protein
MNIRRTLLLLLIFLFTSSSYAAMIRYELGGVIEAVDSRISSVMVGDSWSAILTIDSATMDTNIGDPNSGLYIGPSGSYTISTTVTIDPTQFLTNSINVFNDPGIFFTEMDSLSFRTQMMGPSLDGFEITTLLTGLQDAFGFAFNSDNLSETLGKSISDFASRSFLLHAFDPDAEVILIPGRPPVMGGEFAALQGTVTSYSATAVPIPPAILLFGTALLGMFGFTRKKVSR